MSPLRKKRAKRSAKRKARKTARKPAKKAARRSARKPARRAARRGVKRTARKKAARRAPKRAAAKRTAKRTAKRAPKRAAKKKVAKRAAKKTVRRRAGPALSVVKHAPRRAAKPAPAPEAFAGAKAAASPKELVLFEMERARVAVHAAIQGMSEAVANTPVAAGKWTPRQIVLHMIQRDRESVRTLESAYARNEHPMLDQEQVDAFNAEAIAMLGHHGWDDARRLLQTARGDLRSAFEAIPEEPAEVWSADHAVGWLARFLTDHDRHHADVLKAARIPAEQGPA